MRVLIFISLLLGFTLANAQDKGEQDMVPDLLTGYRIAWLEQELGIPLPPQANLMLYDTLTNWLGTPYRFSGNCTKGIDCSGFVNVLYDRVYGICLGARSSAEIFEKVNGVAKEGLREGDLVFFRIHRRRISHVGLYLYGNKFVHASTSRGVIISDLDEPYYRKYYAGAGRMQNINQGPVAHEKED